MHPLLFNLCIVSQFLSALSASVFSLFHLPLYFFFFCIHWHASNCTELPQRKCSPTHAALTVTLLIYPVRHIVGYYNTLSRQEWTWMHTKYLGQHWKPPLSTLPLWSAHPGLTKVSHVGLLSSSNMGLRWFLMQIFLQHGRMKGNLVGFASVTLTSVSSVCQILRHCWMWWFAFQLSHQEHTLTGTAFVDVCYLHSLFAFL